MIPSPFASFFPETESHQLITFGLAIGTYYLLIRSRLCPNCLTNRLAFLYLSVNLEHILYHDWHYRLELNYHSCTDKQHEA